VESCDRVGLIQAMPAGDSEKDVSGHGWDERVELMRDAIIYNRNNPSILFYESGNNQIREEHMADRFHPCRSESTGFTRKSGETDRISRRCRTSSWRS